MPGTELPSEFNVIHHSGQPPEADSSLYLTVTEEPVGRERFNNEADFESEDAVKLTTRRVVVSGVTVVLERASESHPLFDRLDNHTDIKELVLCADEVVVRSPLRLPGTDIRVYARKLRFEDPGSEQGAFDTTPRSVTVHAAKRDEGVKGQRAGNVYLYVRDLDVQGAATRIKAVGGSGQPARLGVQGDPGSSLQRWDGTGDTLTHYSGHETLNWSDEIGGIPGGYVPVYAQIFAYVAHISWNQWQYQFQRGTQSFPSNGQPPKVLPGYPGQGGDGGSVFSPFAAQLGGRVLLNAGAAGVKAQDVPASEAGKPVKSCHVRAEYQNWVVPSMAARRNGDGILNRKLAVKLLNFANGTPAVVVTSPGPRADAPGPNPATAAGSAGSLRALDRAGNGYWVHPNAVRALLLYLQDLMLAGRNSIARERLAEYVDAVNAETLPLGSNLEWKRLQAELSNTLQRIDGPYDYFGNPAGWVPMLSFETNLQLFNDEVEQSIRTLFLVHWIEKTQKRQQNARSTLQVALSQMETETTRALADFDAALKQLGDVDVQFRTVLTDVDRITAAIEDKEKDLRRVTRENLQLEHVLRSSAKILGGIAQVVPVGQPALGAVGKGITVISDIDIDKPLSSLPKLAGAFSDLAQEKLVPKISKLFEGMKDAEKEVKGTNPAREKYDETLLEKKAEAKVESHLAEQKEARTQIMDAFGNFSVKDSEVEEKLAEVLAASPQYGKLVDEITELNRRKAALAESLIATMEAIDAATATILANQLGRIRLNGQLDATLDRLNQEALQYAQGMGRRARERLLRYQYYVLKSYQYLMLQDLPGLDFRAPKLVAAFADMLSDSPDGSLSAAQYSKLSVVFEEQLRQVTDEIIKWYQSHPPRQGGEFLVSLSPRQIAELNQPAGRLELDLMEMDYLNLQEEDIRITKIETVDVRLAETPADEAVNVLLQFQHGGESRLRRGGHLFLFRTGDYRPAADAESTTKYRDDHMFWGTVIEHHGGKQTIVAMSPDPAEESLLRHLTGSPTKPDDARNALLDFRPAAWAALSIRRSATPSSYAGAISKLVFRVKYVAYAVAESLATVHVRVAGGAQPRIACSQVDLNGRAEGTGSFLRTFESKITRQVTLSAPAVYGASSFIGWRIAGTKADRPAMMPLLKPGTVNVDAGDAIVRQPDLVLDLSKQKSWSVEPLYGVLAAAADASAAQLPPKPEQPGLSAG